MSKKPVPSKKQAVSSTKSRYAKYAHKAQVRLGNAVSLDVCPSCGAPKKMHFVCSECGKYKKRVVISQKSEKATAPIREIKA